MQNTHQKLVLDNKLIGIVQGKYIGYSTRFTPDSPFNNSYYMDKPFKIYYYPSKREYYPQEHKEFGKPHIGQFHSVTQFFEFCKAHTMQDGPMAGKIYNTNTKNDSTYKKLGHSVRNYNDMLWRKNSDKYMKIGMEAKFLQDPFAKKALKETDMNKKRPSFNLINAELFNQIWGSGVDVFQDFSKAPGINKQGKNLMKTRANIAALDEMKHEKKQEQKQDNPFPVNNNAPANTPATNASINPADIPTVDINPNDIPPADMGSNSLPPDVIPDNLDDSQFKNQKPQKTAPAKPKNTLKPTGIKTEPFEHNKNGYSFINKPITIDRYWDGAHNKAQNIMNAGVQNDGGQPKIMIKNNQDYSSKPYVIALTGHRPYNAPNGLSKGNGGVYQEGKDLNNISGATTKYSAWHKTEQTFEKLIKDRLKKHQNVEIESGMAMGADLVWAQAALNVKNQLPEQNKNNLRLVCHVPYSTQKWTLGKWGKTASVSEKKDFWDNKETYENILKQADAVVEYGDDNKIKELDSKSKRAEHVNLLEKRNQGMIMNADEGIAFASDDTVKAFSQDKSTGGTGNGMKDMSHYGVPITIVKPEDCGMTYLKKPKPVKAESKYKGYNKNNKHHDKSYYNHSKSSYKPKYEPKKAYKPNYHANNYSDSSKSKYLDFYKKLNAYNLQQAKKYKAAKQQKQNTDDFILGKFLYHDKYGKTKLKALTVKQAKHNFVYRLNNIMSNPKDAHYKAGILLNKANQATIDSNGYKFGPLLMAKTLKQEQQKSQQQSAANDLENAFNQMESSKNHKTNYHKKQYHKPTQSQNMHQILDDLDL